MIAHLPDRETINTALSLATRAPSINESQPWMWRVGAQSLHLYADPDRGAPDSDAHGRDVLLSCGASLHHCVVALAALGWRAKVERFPETAEPGYLAVLELDRHPASALDIALAAAIPRRRSDWRPYSPWSVSPVDLALIGARAAHAGVTTRRLETAPDLQHVVAQAVWRHTMTESNDDNAVVLALGTKDDSPLARLRAGEATSLVLLSATALGLASCPVAEPMETTEARDTVQDKLFSLVGFPQMLLRIGWAPVDADPLPAPPRRPLADVCEWLEHQSLTSAV